MGLRQVRYCKRCVMNDKSDKNIRFDSNGYCNYCKDALSKINTTTYFPGEVGQKKLQEMLVEIKKENANKPYDCVMGISGGLDSSYLAYLGHKWGLRILAVHIDDGYDTEISKNNIKKLCEKAGIELRTIKPDPEQYNDLILAYMKAGVPNLAVPQDNILMAFLYKTVLTEKLKYFLSGGNFALECVLQKDHVFNAMDMANIKDIHNQFGTKPIDKLEFLSSYKKYFNDKIGRAKQLRPLNYIEYIRDRAFKELMDFCGFEYYGSKHLENILTAFVQCYWFPVRFGVDKRASHLSSMIVSGQMTRERAMEELEKPMYDKEIMSEYMSIIRDKLGLNKRTFESILNGPIHDHEEYHTDKLGMSLHRVLSK